MKRLSMKQFEQETGLHFTIKHTGKMEGMQSLSTSTIINPICRARAKDPNSICSKCYAAKMLERYSNLEQCLIRNTEVLTSSVLEVMPIINASVFRFESFGDLMNSTQVINYFNIAKANPKTTFALWTKNPIFIEQAIKQGNSKPKNMIIIYSSCELNKPEFDIFERFSFIDKVFTVYAKQYIIDNDIDINCGGRKCIECQRCYSKRTGKAVREQVK